MNYFELYELPISFSPNSALVKNKFYELSKKYHPDRFTLSSAEEANNALEMAALNNAAYKTFSNKEAIVAYVLKLKEVLQDEEKHSLPPSFLMEIMDLNEAVSDYEMSQKEADKIQVINDWVAHMNNLQTKMEQCIQEYDTTQETALLNQIKDFYFRQKYLLRIRERIDTFAAH